MVHEVVEVVVEVLLGVVIVDKSEGVFELRLLLELKESW